MLQIVVHTFRIVAGATLAAVVLFALANSSSWSKRI
jgi:hypothetical protein